jgi:predicted nucleic acid-binding Zn ribbon protein
VTAAGGSGGGRDVGIGRSAPGSTRIPDSSRGSREERDRRTGPTLVGDLVNRVLARTGALEQVQRASVLAEWDELVGARIADVTRARSIADATLFVEVRSSAWLTELNLMRHEILGRLNAGRKEGRVERIVFVLAESPDRPRDPTAGGRVRQPMGDGERDRQ